MIYIAICPKCKETVSFLDNQDSKLCKCGEVIINTKYTEKRPVIKNRKIK